MSRKIRLGVLCGGRSAEHEVSVISARSMLEAIDKDKYELVMIGISKEGRWLSAADTQQLLASSQIREDGLTPVALDYLGTRTLVAQQGDGQDQTLDVIFPLLHGPYGEDGTIQGLMELANIAYVGAGVVGSAVGMDKELMKRVFKAEGLPQVDYQVVRRSRWEKDRAGVRAEVEAALAYPVFVKPVNLGSSVGVSKASDGAELEQAIDEAAQYDYKIVVEAEASGCREVEVAILGNESPEASVHRRDRAGQRLLRLQRQIHRRQFRSNHSGAHLARHPRGRARDGHPGLSVGGSLGVGAGGFLCA